MEKQHYLFDDFSPVSPEQWKQKIINDLKNTDDFQKLISHTQEGFDVQPFYQLEHLPSVDFYDTYPGDFPFLRGNKVKKNKWHVNQAVTVQNPVEANKISLDAIRNGADAITFVINDALYPDTDLLNKLLYDIEEEKILLQFKTTHLQVLTHSFTKRMTYRNYNKEKIKGNVDFDLLAHYSLTGEVPSNKSFAALEEAIKTTSSFPYFRVLSVDGTIFHNSGGSAVSEIAFTLAMGSFLLQHFTDAGFSVEQIAENIHFRLVAGADYFMTIAKFRAFRYLWAQILKAFGVSIPKAHAFIHAESSFRNKTVYDPYVNLLRTTTETMSAILGGVDVVTVLPFDSTFRMPSAMAERIARNQQLILKEESFFDKVIDPAAGSYYIENLTVNLVEKSWELFLETEDKGGYLQAFQEQFIQKYIEKEARNMDADVAYRKVSIVGVNRFPNISEQIDKSISAKIFETERNISEELPVLQPYRYASSFERLRFATDLYARQHSRPVVWLFPVGDLSLRRARAQFAENFFGCAGFHVVDNTGFDNVQEGIKAAKNAHPQIVVLCGDDKTYQEIALIIFEALKNETIVVVAGYPKTVVDQLKKAGMQHFIHLRSNMLEELKKFQKLLHIDVETNVK